MKPIFSLLNWLYAMIGNFGLAIICLTLIVRTLMFPIAQKQFKSMAAMRVLQPKMKALQDRHKDDKPRLQQEMLKLYQEEKVNPMAGCLPILIQIPIFYALYKVLMVSVEMRHKPFVLWIKDLSAPDPLTPVNLFGYLPFTPPSFLALGVLPILLGITMWLQFKLNPPADRPGAAADVRDHALGADVRDGAVRGRASALLDGQQRPHHPPAEMALQPLSRDEGGRRKRRRRRSERRRDRPRRDGPEALFRADRLPEVGAGAQVPARSGGAGSGLRRPLQRRQVVAAQRARPTATASPAPRTRRGGPRSSTSSTSASRCASGWSTCPATASPRRPRTWSRSGAS